ncbi:shTK domain protein [Oesophagostomum dentatum]|uniref:ShTK domain protein n=1 Tax=Oesophagostomum dentatum TaxID=61180 RepID=A0A0B1TAG0_OESDE|nr:shTK domain protein [Oesophagostomum dentatum]
MFSAGLVTALILRLASGLIQDIEDEECVDKSPYCNTNDCTVRPGYALEYCRKTCGDCEPFCHNSHFVNCKESRKPECDSMLKDYCPLLCGACRPIKKKTSKGFKSVSRAPLSIANLRILQKFSKPKTNRTETQLQNADTVGLSGGVGFGATEPPVSAPSQRPSHNPTRGWSHHQSAQRQYHPAYSSSQWLLPYPQNPQAYPVTAYASPPRRYSPGFYGSSIGAQLEGPQGSSMGIGDLVTLLGCHDKDPSVCSKITEESCLSRPGYYLKLCPVKCKNCNGLQCLDSIKIDCFEVRRLGGCKLPTAAEYCPRTCRLCALPAAIAESLPPCKDELETCENLAESGVCEHPYSRNALRTYCAKSCGFCRDPQYYMNDVPHRNFLMGKEK